MMQMQMTWVMFGKEPVAGRVKTRLMSVLTGEEAATLYRAFLLDSGRLLRRVADQSGLGRLVLAYAPDDRGEAFREIFGDGLGFELWPQGEGGLGSRLWRVVRRCLVDVREVASGVVVIGSDSPTLPDDYVRQAERLLSGGDLDVVIGPSVDGGYYLIGVRGVSDAEVYEKYEKLFSDELAWSTCHLLSQTLQVCRAEGLRVRLLPFWYDVDEFEDLLLLKAHILDYLVWDAAAERSEAQGCLEQLAARGYFDVERSGED
jgi:rSAM/selenodomain-associated transferase 1